MRNVLIHIHIFKNAGTTFDSTLKNNFKEDFIDHRNDKEILEGKYEYLLKFLKNNKNIKAFSSHSIHFLLKSLKELNLIPIYFIRHPIERILSVYNFERKQTPIITEGSRKAKELNFNDFINWYMDPNTPATIRNIQTIFLSGDGPSPTNIEYKYEVAKRNLLSENSLIGVVDRYDETMVVFEEKLKKFFPKIDLAYVPKNVTNKNFNQKIVDKVKVVENKLNKNVLDLVYENNIFDLKLYKLANEKLDNEINKIENFENKLKNFKERCIKLKS